METTDKIFQVVIPERTVVKVKGGKRTEKKEKEYPGYVLVDMVLDEMTWATVREAPGVLGFIGDKNRPTTLSEAEVRRILRKNAILDDVRLSEKEILISTWEIQ